MLESLAVVAQQVGILFALMAVVAWLRLDGIRLPRLMMLRVHPRKKPTRLYGDIADHLDDDIILFDDLEKEEQDVCVLLADALLAVVCFALAAVLGA